MLRGKQGFLTNFHPHLFDFNINSAAFSFTFANCPVCNLAVISTYLSCRPNKQQ
jgi:hypothetical protein